jgi:hypothetical protein
MKKIITLVLLIVCTGCMGKIYMVRSPEIKNNEPFEGVIVYQPKPLILVVETTQLQDKDGKILGSSDEGACTPVPSYEITSVPNYKETYIIKYDHGLLESGKFSLELNNGVISKINSEYSSAAKDALGVVQEILGTVKTMKGLTATLGVKEIQSSKSAKPACNAGKKITESLNISDIDKTKPENN